MTKKLLLLLAILLPAVFLAAGASADDRDLLRESSSDPYVFIVFDTSGSMHWTPQCTQAQFDNGECDFLCPTGDCFAPRNGDDPASKFHQAKAALYEVIEQVDGIQFGFATYNQDDLVMRDKHWLYHVSENRPDGTPNDFIQLLGGDRWPDLALRCTGNNSTCTSDADCGADAGTCEYEDVFGATWNCDEGFGDEEKACWGNTGDVADFNDAWEVRRGQRVPKLGRGPDFSGLPPSGEFRDNFSNDSFNNDDGSLSWSTAWIESDHPGGGGPTAGNAQISGGRLRLDDAPNENGRPSFARQADLSNYASAELTFDWWVTGDLEREDRIVLEVSSNGGASWSFLDDFDNFTGPTNGSRSYDISNRIASNTRIRFRVANQFHGSDEQFQVDNLELRGRPTETTIYFRNTDLRRYKFIYRPVPTLLDGTPNDYSNPQLAVEIEVRLCTNTADNCASSFVDEKIIYYDRVGDFGSWDNGARRGPRTMGFFRQGQAGDGDARNTCAGWDDNDDTSADFFPNTSGYNLRFSTDPDPPPMRFDTDGDGVKDVADFSLGDLIPLDWEKDHRDTILGRLAPNTIANPSAVPDFGVASYFADARVGSDQFLRLDSESARPLIADGSTPLGNTIRDFRTWYSGCATGNCPNDDGWADLAARFDPDFNCRKKFLMVLTDGDNTCSGPSACSGTAGLRAQTGIKTFVVAFGVQGGGGNTLTCMAANGGTGDPIFPQNKQELVDALLQLFTDIKVQSRAFASASVPTVQNETSDKIYLSNFTPLPDAAVWPGRLDAFRKPLPLKDDGTPDFNRSCTALGIQGGCHLWNAAERLLDQAPRAAEAANGDYRVGLAPDERRVFYSRENVTGTRPASLRLLKPPTSLMDDYDLWRGLDVDFTVSDVDSETAARQRATDIIGETLSIKEVTVSDPDTGENLFFEYVMGDIFHADPQILGSPNNLIYFREDLHSYQDFANRHFWRRKMLAIAANDGQIHFFDAGIRRELFDPQLQQTVERFTDGNGRELFSYIPRMVLPIVRNQAEDTRHIYSLDGPSAVADVFIRPTTTAEPEWRSVLIAGLREGGDAFRSSADVRGFVSGYFALDLTMPDRLFQPGPTPDDPNPRPYPIPVGQTLPSCMALDADGNLGPSGNCALPPLMDTAFPAELWSFTGQSPVSLGGPYYLDEDDINGDGVPDGNGERDLGDTWSKPVIGRIQVCGDGGNCDPAVEPNDIEERFVAVFGGGLEPKNPLSSLRGNWIYMLDVERGEVIYKRQLLGAAAASPTVLDANRDGYFDTIYIGTSQGFLYKIDLTALDSGGDVPGFEDVTIDNSRLVGSPLGLGTSAIVERIVDPAWDPVAIFSTEGKPIFMETTAFNVPALDQFALAFGTGNRQNLWRFDGVPGRFYVIVDEDYSAASSNLPRLENNYAFLDPDSPNTVINYLTDPPPTERGWVLRFGPDERVITQAFALVGVVVVTAFDPQEAADLDGDGDIDACARSGVSRAFVMSAENGNAFVGPTTDPDILSPESGGRYQVIGDFTTAPYVDQTTSKNPDSGAGNTTETEELTEAQIALQEAIREALKKFFPEGCRFNASYSLTVNASRSDTGHVRYATIPLAMCAVDWKKE